MNLKTRIPEVAVITPQVFGDSRGYGPARNVEKITPEIRDEMVEEFHKKYPRFRYDCLEILTDEEEKSDAVL